MWPTLAREAAVTTFSEWRWRATALCNLFFTRGFLLYWINCYIDVPGALARIFLFSEIRRFRSYLSG
jgi:hypothetical protein